jgi:chromosome segregation ATPase
MELAEAKKLLGARAEYIAAAKRESEQIRRQAEEQAKQLVAQDTTLAAARQKANELIGRAEERTRELRRTANDYCEDTLRRTEEGVAAAYDKIKRQRAKFRAVSAQESGTAAPDRRSNAPYDVEADNGP